MILTCPDCATRYSAEGDAIGANGRTVRCSKCDATWFVESADAMALRELEDEGALEPADIYQPPTPIFETSDGYEGPDRRTNTQPGAHVLLRRKKDLEMLKRKMVGVRAIWAVTLFLMCGAMVWAVAGRHNIVKKHPRAATLYQKLGMDVSNTGFRFADVKTRSSLVDGQPVLIVNGTILSNTHKTAPQVPMVELTFLDVAGKPISSWNVDVNAKTLAALGKSDFAAQYPNPPIDAVALGYGFAGQSVSISASEPMNLGGLNDDTEEPDL